MRPDLIILLLNTNVRINSAVEESLFQQYRTLIVLVVTIRRVKQAESRPFPLFIIVANLDYYPVLILRIRFSLLSDFWEDTNCRELLIWRGQAQLGARRLGKREPGGGRRVGYHLTRVTKSYILAVGDGAAKEQKGYKQF